MFNKPTLKYRVEGFAFFVCNAWELMLKAEMAKQLGENFYDVKANSAYCYAHKTDGKISHYTYSSALIDFIVAQIKKTPLG